jgi:murein DD-endopeptidase MepM/ murein hydrolase activator NlpD
LQNKGKTVFGQREPKHILILANGDKVRHMVIRPWMLAIAASFIGVMAIGYLLATTYLVMRDDLIGASTSQHARLQHSYEDRIAKLRSELDRVTSRQLLNQQVVQNKVAELMQRQATLNSRHGQISPILDRAGLLNVDPAQIPIPSSRSNDQANLVIDGKQSRVKTAFVDDTTRLFGTVALSLEHIEKEQIDRIQLLALNTSRKTAEITKILKGSKLPAPKMDETHALNAVGGPFMPAPNGEAFNYSLRGLDEALQQFDKVLTHVANLPLKYPVIGAKISSKFGTRRDPFLGRSAFHSGMDFKAKSGTRVRSVGKGKVISAGWKGGYGKMVEIDHGHGTTTRYAHLSRINVSVGKYVNTDTVIGKVGSTGRSTGPHLHYEIRRFGKAVNPSRYLNVGSKLRPLLKSS